MFKVTVEFEREGNGQNEIVSHVDRSESERDFETEILVFNFHRM